MLDSQLERIVRAGTIDTRRGVYDANAILNSRAEMIAALETSGYNDLAAAYVNTFDEAIPLVDASFAKLGLPKPRFNAGDAETFLGLKQLDLAEFERLGTDAVEQLHLAIYNDAIVSTPFEDVVATIKAATVGTAESGAPLANFAYTHANTAYLDFSGAVIIKTGENLGWDQPDSLWEVVGPEDGKNRPICSAALDNPIRTRAEWEAAGYFGSTPGGWNCRHQLFPYQGPPP